MKDLPEGSKVKVTACLYSHHFDIGQIVIREAGVLDDDSGVAFVSESGEAKWYLHPDEYEVVATTFECQQEKITKLENKIQELERVIAGYRALSISVMKA